MGKLIDFLRMYRNAPVGLNFTFCDLSDVNNLEASINDKTKMIWVESPTNPLLKIADLSAISAFAKKHNLISVCDNTFCSPCSESNRTRF